MVCWNRQWKRVLGKKGINQGDFQELTEPFGQLQSSVSSKQSSVMFFREGVTVPHLSVNSEQ